MGLELFVSNAADRLVTVTAINIPAGIEDAKVRRQLLDEFNIEIAGGLGPIKGKIWRVGLMGYSCQETNVLLFLAAFEKTLLDQGFRLPAGAGVAAAVKSYQHSSQPADGGRKEVGKFMAKTAIPTRIPNVGAMSEFIGAFDVPSKVTDYVYRCRFSHCWNGIATRHSDTMDCKFVVDGKGVVLGLAHPGFVKFRGTQRPQSIGPRGQLHRRRISSRAA